ncbi:EAL domain-containing protein [Vibrio sp. 10N.261.46.E11]|uniref:bifunctional diguanylate cyclase/phosphodiesterase n=1 Tax=Vibrio sp. 10N.261.46.E11 TaxID=3229662 RepID=UPI0035566B15
MRAEQLFKDQHKQLLKSQVDVAKSQVLYLKSTTESELKQVVKERLEEAHRISTRLYEDNRSQPIEVIESVVKSALKDIRFNNDRGYLFIVDRQSKGIMHPFWPHLEGQDLSTLKDTRGTAIVTEMVKLSLEKETSFYRWWFHKPGDNQTEYEKIGYSIYFEPLDWVISSGDYVVDVENDLKKQSLNWLNSLKLPDSDQLFVIDKQGVFLAHESPELVGTKHPTFQSFILNEDIIEANHEGFVTLGVKSNNSQSSSTLNYVTKIPDWDWFIVGSAYTQAINQYSVTHKQLTEESLKRDTIELVIYSSAGFVTLLILSFYTSNAIARRFTTFQGQIRRDFHKLEQNRKELSYLAHHDSLTGLYNRTALKESFAVIQERNIQNTTKIALLFIDLDDFKNINDAHGHGYGDQLLKNIAQTLQHLTEPNEMYFRFGGDEFIAIIDNLPTAESLTPILSKIKPAIERSYDIKGESLSIKASIGVSLSPDHADNIEMLISKADMALYFAKRTSKGIIQLFDESISDDIHSKLEIQNALNSALNNDELYVHYQPQIDVHSGVVLGVEALCRWQNKKLGFIPPDVFISMAEKTSLINDITFFVAETSMRRISKINRKLGLSLSLSINLSPAVFTQRNLVERFSELAAKYAMAPEKIKIEITESVLVEDLQAVTQVMNRFQALGMQVSIDDFGTGYSSLSYIASLPINEIKIDKSFVDTIDTDARQFALVEAITSLANIFSFDLVVEGIETKAQLQSIQQLYCSAVQGYYYSRPVSATDLVEYLELQNQKEAFEV